MAIPGTLRGWPATITWVRFRKVRSAPDGEDHSALTVAPFPATYAYEYGRGTWRLVKVSVKVFVHPSQSWVVSREQSQELLRHEQGHFDISGIAGRDLLRELVELGDVGFGSKEELLAQIGTARAALQRTVDDTNALYDEETRHGIAVDDQLRWQKKIARVIEHGRLIDISP